MRSIQCLRRALPAIAPMSTAEAFAADAAASGSPGTGLDVGINASHWRLFIDDRAMSLSLPAGRGGEEIARRTAGDHAAAAGGEIRIELLDEAGQVLPGYSADQCDTIWTDRVAIPVRWSADEDLTTLGSRQIRVRFRMRNAHLYSFTLAPLKCGDFDADRDVDVDDFAVFRSCQSGPAVPQPDPYCRQADLDAEGDVDMDDSGLFQQAFTGAGRG